MSNENLNKGKKKKNDEFYTFYKDIEKELVNYKEKFKDKIVYCNCDTAESNFVKYFKNNFKELGLKELIYTGNDFFSIKNWATFKKADIIVTNPPFSMMKRFIVYLVENNKKFLIIGPFNIENTIYYYNYYLQGKIWKGYNHIYWFKTSTKPEKKHAVWFTNLKKIKKKPLPIFTEKYNEKKYKKYLNYDAIEVNKIKNIPIDYKRKMGVSYTILEYEYEKDFRIIKLASNFLIGEPPRKLFARYIIKRKEENMEKEKYFICECCGFKDNEEDYFDEIADDGEVINGVFHYWAICNKCAGKDTSEEKYQEILWDYWNE